MSWKDRLLPASYRGVPFVVEAHTHEGGRRLQRHEIPYRDNPVHRDHGRMVRTFRIEAYLVGEDYDLGRDQLLKALETPGRGLLVHPHLGGRDVVVSSFRLSETVDEGRMARVTIDFEEAKAPERIRNRPDVSRSVAAVGDAAEQHLGTAIVSGAQRFRDTMQSGVTNFTRTVRKLNVFSGIQVEVESMESELRFLEDNVSDLILAPLELANAMRRIIDTIARASASPEVALGAYKELGKLILKDATRSARELANQLLLNGLIRSVSVAGVGSSLVAIEWVTRDDAYRQRDEFSASVDVASVGASDVLFDSLLSLRSAVFASVPPEGAELPFLRQVSPAGTTNALTMAYALFDDATRDAEIVGRNPFLWYPGAITGGSVLEVLSQ